MQTTDLIQLALFVIALVSLTPVLGSYMANVLEGKTSFLRPLESLAYRFASVDEHKEMDWKEYAYALLMFNAMGLIFVFALQILQGLLPLNPQSFSGVGWSSALNTAVSFVTNTNWQGYAGETTMSYLSQMLGLSVQNFVSAATGMAVFVALVRSLIRRSGTTIGNFWVDLTRTTLYILLPLCFAFAIVLAGQGVVQTFNVYQEVTTLEGAAQTLPLGPAASQIAIKQLGTNGVCFFNANSAFPFENPTPLTNFLQMLALLLIPAASTFTFGRMVKSQRQGWVLFGVMFVVWFGVLLASIASEYATNPIYQQAGFKEGKEVRFADSQMYRNKKEKKEEK